MFSSELHTEKKCENQKKKINRQLVMNPDFFFFKNDLRFSSIYLFICCTEEYNCTGNREQWHMRAIKALEQSRWPESIYMRVGYVFESRFSAGMI